MFHKLGRLSKQARGGVHAELQVSWAGKHLLLILLVVLVHGCDVIHEPGPFRPLLPAPALAVLIIVLLVALWPSNVILQTLVLLPRHLPLNPIRLLHVWDDNLHTSHGKPAHLVPVLLSGIIYKHIPALLLG